MCNQRITKQQFGNDKLHPSTYLNNQRWEDEHETNNGQLAPNGKQSAAERQAASVESKYGQAKQRIWVWLRAAEIYGEQWVRGENGGNAISYVEPSSEQVGSIDCAEEWNLNRLLISVLLGRLTYLNF